MQSAGLIIQTVFIIRCRLAYSSQKWWLQKYVSSRTTRYLRCTIGFLRRACCRGFNFGSLLRWFLSHCWHGCCYHHGADPLRTGVLCNVHVTTRAVCRVALSRSKIGGPGGLDLFCLTGLSPPPVLYVHLSGPVPYTIVHHDSRLGTMWRFSVLWLLRIRDTSHRGALASVMSPGKALRLLAFACC